MFDHPLLTLKSLYVYCLMDSAVICETLDGVVVHPIWKMYIFILILTEQFAIYYLFLLYFRLKLKWLLTQLCSIVIN